MRTLVTRWCRRAALVLATLVAPTFASAQPTITPIHDIQGPGASSPIVGSSVTTRGIVTGVKSNGFFIQESDAQVDADPNTSEGIFVFTSSVPPAAAVVGALVEVQGTVAEFVPSADPQQPPVTELVSPVVVPLSSGNPLPAAIPLTATFPDPAGVFDQLERVEHMRVSVTSLTVTGPSGGPVNEAAATGTSNGRFDGVVTGVARPFREAGIRHPDVAPSGTIPPIPRWDTNPELLRVDSVATGEHPILTVKSGDVVGPLIGPLDYASRAYTILLTGTGGGFTPGTLPTTVSVAAGNDITVASFNLQRFFDDVDDPAKTDGVLTTTAYQNRLAKASIAIRTHLRNPDIIGVQQVENLAVLSDLAAAIAANSGPTYQPFLLEGNDAAGLDVGVLIKTDPVSGGVPRVSSTSLTQEGLSTTWIDPVDNQPALLLDRPPIVLQAVVNRSPSATTPIVVIVTDLFGMEGIDSQEPNGLTTEGDRVRRKRLAQAEFLANLVQSRQTIDPSERLVVVGDLNAFQFNDGYADVVNTIAGTPPPDNETVVPGDGVDLVNPDLTNLVSTLAPAERYSSVIDGNASNVDHVLVSAGLIAGTIARRIERARIGADYPETERNNNTTALRISDHDPVVAYFAIEHVDGPPTISDITDQTIPRNSTTGALPFVIGDVETPAANLALSGTSSDTTIVPNENIVFGGSGANRTVTVTPAAGQHGGPVTITVIVSDGVLFASDTFLLTVTANEAPTLTGLADATMEETKALTQTLTLSDDGPVDALTVTATSSNDALLPDAAVVVTGTGATRTLTLTPIEEKTGETIVTLIVSDGELTTTRTARLIVTAAPPPDPPTGLVASVVGNLVTFTWTAPAAGATPTFYVIEGGTWPGATTLPVINTGVRETQWTLKLPASRYYFRVRAANRAGTSDRSNEAVVIASAAALPGPPIALLATVNGNRVGLQWAPATVGGAPSVWQIELGSVPGSQDRGVFHVPVDLTSVAGALDPGEYLLRIRGVNAAGEGPASNEVRLRVGAAPVCEVPEPPVLLPATVVDRIVQLSWRSSRNTAVTDYQVLVGLQPGVVDLPAFHAGTVNGLAGVAAPGQYFVMVVATNDCGASLPSNTILVDVTSQPPAPANLRATVDGPRVTVAWDAVPGVDGYVLEAGTAENLADLGSVTTTASGIVANGVTPGTYFLRVRAIRDGVMSSPSGEIVVVVPPL